MRGHACFTLAEFTNTESETKLHMHVLAKFRTASLLTRVTEPMKQMVGSGVSNNNVHDVNLAGSKCGVECN